MYVTGHSLGGALSTLCTYDLAARKWEARGIKPPRIACYTFGQPRVVNRPFAETVSGWRGCAGGVLGGWGGLVQAWRARALPRCSSCAPRPVPNKTVLPCCPVPHSYTSWCPTTGVW